MIHSDSRRWLLYIPGGLFLIAGLIGLLVALTLPLYSAAGWLQDRSYRLDLAVAGVLALAVGIGFIGFIRRDLGRSANVRGRVVLKYYNEESAIIAIVPDGDTSDDVTEFAIAPQDYARVTNGDEVTVAYSPFLRLVRRIEIVPEMRGLQAA